VASPLVGGLSDVYGRKPVMLICLVSQCISVVNLCKFYSFIFTHGYNFCFLVYRLGLHHPMFCGHCQKALHFLCWQELLGDSVKAM
jgi:MFS family permease